MQKLIFQRETVAEIKNGMKLSNKFLHIITGPRQVGKSTAANQIADSWEGEVVSSTADSPIPPGPQWIEQHWLRAFSKAQGGTKTLLILDEIQKVTGWSEVIKRLWDQAKLTDPPLYVLLLGSSSLLLSKGMTESLTGRFLKYSMSHWSFKEMNQAFGFDLPSYIYFGGYPGSVELISNESVWKQYILNSLIETVLTKDVLQMQVVTKPALLRHLFFLSMSYPAHILSYNKMLGQLQDAGNTTTLAHYLKILESAFLVSGLERYHGNKNMKRGSSPKLIAWNNALVTSLSEHSFENAMNDPELWGWLVENAVGGYLMNNLPSGKYSIRYWREKNNEVDFVVSSAKKTWAIEVKSNRVKKVGGLKKFCENYSNVTPVIIGGTGIPLEKFFMDPVLSVFE